jgi:hypothetical protein
MSNEDKDVFQQQITFTLDPGTLGQGTTFTVPAEKRLVIPNRFDATKAGE